MFLGVLNHLMALYLLNHLIIFKDVITHLLILVIFMPSCPSCPSSHLIIFYAQLPELSQFSVGLMHIQLLHTSASLAINENWDPDVRDDMEMMLNRIVPEDMPFRHSCEGPDDMVSNRLWGGSLHACCETEGSFLSCCRG